MRAKTLYVTDLDGTLLDDCSRVTPKSAGIISDLSRQGALITAATARTPATVQPLMRGVFTTVPAITMTGAALWDRNSCRYLNIRMMPRPVAEQALALCRREGVMPFIYTHIDGEKLEVYRNGPCSKGEALFIEERRGLELKQFHIDTPQGEADYLPGTILMFAMGPRETIFAVADELRSSVDCSVSAYVDIFGEDTGILEIFARGVSKANAIRDLADSIGADRIVAFGDNLNDLPMGEIADEFYAVANALPAVKEAATDVIGPNTADSVALKIRQLEQGW